MILIEWFTPGYKAGGPIRSCVNLCVALKDQYDIYVLTTDTDHGATMPYAGIKSNEWITSTDLGVQVYYAKKQSLSFGKMAKLVKEMNADFIYLNLLFSPHFIMLPLYLKYSGKIKGTVILCPRGTLYDSAIRLKWYVKKPFIRLLNWMNMQQQILFHATNEREETAIGQYFPGSKIIIADNLPNTVQRAFVTCKKEEGSLRCIFISRIVPIKNLAYLLKLLLEVKNRVTLTIVGPVENESYWIECNKLIQQLPENIQVTYEGPKQNEELAALIHANHLLVLPTTGENFGHAIFEALLAGRPVLISDQTPWQNLSEHKAGWAFPLDTPQKFISQINELADCDQRQFDLYANSAWNYAQNFISNPRITAPYKKLFN